MPDPDPLITALEKTDGAAKGTLVGGVVGTLGVLGYAALTATGAAAIGTAAVAAAPVVLVAMGIGAVVGWLLS